LKRSGERNFAAGLFRGHNQLKDDSELMAHGEVTEIIPAPSQAVFDLIHDYSRRLEWDTLLQAAIWPMATLSLAKE
jgi:hypothetical protein